MAVADAFSSPESGGAWRRRRWFDRHCCWDAALPADLVEQLCRNPDGLLAAGSKLQHKLSCTVVRIDHAAGEFVWKRYAGGGLRRLRRALVRPSPARKAWIDGRFLQEAGVPTPRPRAYVERRVGPIKTDSYVLMDYIPGTSLYRFMRYERPAEHVVRGLAQQVAAIWQRLDDMAVCHNDFKTENLLVDPQGKLWLIDLDRMFRFRSCEEVRRGQMRDARDLLHVRNWRSDPAAAEIFRQAILLTIAAGEAMAGPQSAGHPLNRPTATTNCPSQLFTALIPCRNAAHTITACLESLRDYADEILVADAGSTDETLRLVQEFGGCRIVRQPSGDEVAFETWASRHATHPWILRILPEERLTPELGRQVQDVLAANPTEDGFKVLQAVPPGGRRLKLGDSKRDASIRLFRKGAGSYEMRAGRADVAIASRRIGCLASRLLCESGGSIARRVA